MSSTESADPRIGHEFVVPPSPHGGHTMTVEKRDAEGGYWLVCSCGSKVWLESAALDRYIADPSLFPWDLG